MLGPKNNIYVLLDGRTLWSYEENTRTWRNAGHISKTFAGLEENVRGGVRDRNGNTWFTKGKLNEI